MRIDKKKKRSSASKLNRVKRKPRAKKAKLSKAKKNRSSGDKVSRPKRGGVEELDRDTSKTESDPHAAREVTRRQAEASSKLTGGTDSQEPSLFDKLESEEAAGPRFATATSTSATDGAEDAEPGEKLDHLVDDPTQEEQRSDLETPEGFQTGTETPQFPDLSNQEPSESKPLPLGGTEETFQKDGVTYTRQTRPDGSVHTSYEEDGTTYNDTTYEDGRNSVLISRSDDTGTHSRTVERDAEGNLVNDRSHSTQAETDPATGEITLQSRQESLSEDNVRTITEEVTRPDGGRATTTRTEQPGPNGQVGGGAFEEKYEYEGDDGSLVRTTNQTAEGFQETRTERTSYSEESLEELTDVPGRPDGVPGLPSGERGDTRVKEVEVVTTEPQGQPEVQYRETQYSQSSGDVQAGDVLPQGVTASDSDTQATLTVTTVEARNPETSALESSTAASAEIKVSGEREDGSPVSATRTDNWDGTGKSSTNYGLEGFTRNDQRRNASPYGGSQFEATVGDQTIEVFPSRVDGKHVDNHLKEKGSSPGRGGDAVEYLDVDGNRDAVVDVNISVSRDAEGEVTSEGATWSLKDENGDGKSVSRVDNGEQTAWTYENVENGGDDLSRQTVIEGTEISVFEEYHKTGRDTFTHHQEMRDGDEVSSSRDVSREHVDEAGLNALVQEGVLDQAQRERLITDGPPYIVDKVTDHANARIDGDGNLLKDDDGNVIQGGHHLTSTSVSNEQGYRVSNQFLFDSAAYTEEELSTVTDPTADPPISGSQEKRFYDRGTKEVTRTESGDLEVRSNGDVMIGDDKVAEFELGGDKTVNDLLSGESAEEVLTNVSDLAREGGTQFIDDMSGSKLKAFGSGLDKLGKFTDALGLATGSLDLVNGLRDRDVATTLEGIDGVAGGVESLAGALANLKGPVGQAATKFTTSAAGMAFGALGGGINIGLGLYDVFTADSGYDKAAGGLTAASGVALAATPFFPPAAIGAIILGGAAYFVSRGDENNTAAIDERVR